MDTQNIENTLKKMGLVLEKMIQKIDNFDKRVAALEEKIGVNEKKFSSGDLKAAPQTQPQTQKQQNSTSKSFGSGFGSSFLGSLGGAMAGMGLYNLLFNHSVTPNEFGYEMGMNDNEINESLNQNFDEIDSKFDELDSKIDELDQKVDNENFVDNNDFDSGFDDFGDFDDV